MKEMQQQLFVVVMTVGCKHINMNLRIEDAVNEPVLLCYLATPSTFGLAFQRFRMSQSGFRMLIKFTNEFHRFLISFWLMKKQAFQVFHCLFLDDTLYSIINYE